MTKQGLMGKADNFMERTLKMWTL